MKKILLIISLVAFIVTKSEGQSLPFRIGVKTGPNIDWVSPGSTVANNSGIGIGFRFGVVGDYYFTRNVAVSTGVDANFLKTNYHFVDFRRIENFLEETQVPVDRHIKANNLDIPIKVKMRMDVFDSWKAFVEAGAGMSFNLKDQGKDKYNIFGVAHSDSEYVDYTRQYRVFQASIVFGVGAEYEINRKLSLFAQISFDHALSNVFNKQLEKLTGSDLKTNFIGLEVGTLF